MAALELVAGRETVQLSTGATTTATWQDQSVDLVPGGKIHFGSTRAGWFLASDRLLVDVDAGARTDVTFDRDIREVWPVAGGFLVILEDAVVHVENGVTRATWELSDVFLSSSWQGDVLVVNDARNERLRIETSGSVSLED